VQRSTVGRLAAMSMLRCAQALCPGWAPWTPESLTTRVLDWLGNVLSVSKDGVCTGNMSRGSGADRLLLLQARVGCFQHMQPQA
jgi:hypothetical protein